MTDTRVKTKERLEQRMRELMDSITAANPLETFEPHEAEEGKFNIEELHEARLERLFVEAVLRDPDKELAEFLIGEVAREIGKSRH
jgi:hypothetical protein